MMHCRVVPALLLLAISGSYAVHETVVDSILDSLAKEVARHDGAIREFSYLDKMTVGPIMTDLKVYLYTGSLLIQSLRREGNVTYREQGSDGAAGFEFATKMKAFLAYRYRFTASNSVFSCGTATADLPSVVMMKLEVSPEMCTLNLKNFTYNPTNFNLDVLPTTNDSFYPSTLHLLPGNAFVKHIQSAIKDFLGNAINGRKICDILNCWSKGA